MQRHVEGSVFCSVHLRQERSLITALALTLGCVVCFRRSMVESARKLALCLLCHGSLGTAVHSSLRDLVQSCVAAAKPKSRCPNPPKQAPLLVCVRFLPHHHQAHHDHPPASVTAQCSDRSSLPSFYVVSHCCSCLLLLLFTILAPGSIPHSSETYVAPRQLSSHHSRAVNSSHLHPHDRLRFLLCHLIPSFRHFRPNSTHCYLGPAQKAAA